MIGLSNAQIGSNAEISFTPSSVREISIENGQPIVAGDLCAVMADTLSLDGSKGTKMIGYNDLVSGTADANHIMFGGLGKPHLLNNNIMQAFMISGLKVGSTNYTTATSTYVKACLTTSTYLYSVHWSAETKDLSWNEIAATANQTTTTNSADDCVPISDIPAFAWGEPYEVGDGYWLIPGQFGGTASAVDRRRGTVRYYPAQINLIKIDPDTGVMTRFGSDGQDVTTGLASATTTSMTPISSYVPTGRPFICPIREDIGLKQTFDLPSIGGVTTTINADTTTTGTTGFKFSKKYQYLMVYNCHNTTATTFATEAKPFEVDIYSTKTVYPHSTQYTINQTPTQSKNSNLQNLKTEMAKYGLTFDYSTDDQGKTTYTKSYTTTVLGSTGKIKHTISFEVYYDETLNVDYAYTESHGFEVLAGVTSLSEDDINEFVPYSKSGTDAVITFSIGDGTEQFSYDDLQDELLSSMTQTIAFTADEGQTCGTGSQILYGMYCHFSNLDTGHVMFLTTTSDTVAEAHAEYSVYHMFMDNNEITWTTNPIKLKPEIDTSIAKWSPGIAYDAGNNALNEHIYNTYSKYYMIENSQKMPLVLSYYNNLNMDNVIRTSDGKHCLAIFPHYYYDFEVDWDKALITATIKSMHEENHLQQLFVTKHVGSQVTLNNGSFGPVLLTTQYIPDSALAAIGQVYCNYAMDADIATGNLTNSYCYNTKLAACSVVPMVYKVSDTAYAISYIAPLTGYPGVSRAPSACAHLPVTNFVYFIEDIPKFYACNQYGLVADGCVAATSSGVLPAISGQTGGLTPNYPNNVAYPEVAYMRPFAFVSPNSDNTELYLQMHSTYYVGGNYPFYGCSTYYKNPLPKGIYKLLAYPVNSTTEEEPATTTAYKRPILFGVAKNSIGAQSASEVASGELLKLSGKVKLYSFLFEE